MMDYLDIDGPDDLDNLDNLDTDGLDDLDTVGLDDLDDLDDLTDWPEPQPSEALKHFLMREEWGDARERRALLWAAAQPALKPWLAVHVLPAERALLDALTDHLPVTVSADVVHARARDIIEALRPKTLAPDAEGLAERLRGIENEMYLNLPSANVRAAVLRALNIERHRRAGTAKKYMTKAMRRLVNMLMCGRTKQEKVVDPNSGEVVEYMVPYECGAKGCRRRYCFVRSGWDEKRGEGEKRISAVAKYGSAHGRRMIMITTATPWFLPTDEVLVMKGAKRFSVLPATYWDEDESDLHKPERLAVDLPKVGAMGHPTPWAGKMMSFTLNPEAPRSFKGVDLTYDRLEEHRKSRNDFLGHSEVRKVLSPVTSFTTEVAYLCAGVPGHRCYPNWHTHVVTSVDPELDLEALEQALTTRWKLATRNNEAEVFIKEIDPTEESCKKLAKYFAKTVAITPNWKALRAALRARHEVEVKNAPKGSEAFSVIDDRSLTELLNLFDFVDPKLTGYVQFRRNGKVSQDVTAPLPEHISQAIAAVDFVEVGSLPDPMRLGGRARQERVRRATEAKGLHP
jgi:hypothetical protein